MAMLLRTGFGRIAQRAISRKLINLEIQRWVPSAALTTTTTTAAAMINVSQRQYSSRPIAGPSSAAETSVARKFFVRRAEIQERKLILLLLERSKVTIKTINRMYKDGEPISVMTAQDYPSGMMVDRAGIDVCLVGDSLAMVALGYDSTNPLTVDVRSPPPRPDIWVMILLLTFFCRRCCITVVQSPEDVNLHFWLQIYLMVAMKPLLTTLSVFPFVS